MSYEGLNKSWDAQRWNINALPNTSFYQRLRDLNTALKAFYYLMS